MDNKIIGQDLEKLYDLGYHAGYNKAYDEIMDRINLGIDTNLSKGQIGELVYIMVHDKLNAKNLRY